MDLVDRAYLLKLRKRLFYRFRFLMCLPCCLKFLVAPSIPMGETLSSDLSFYPNLSYCFYRPDPKQKTGFPVFVLQIIEPLKWFVKVLRLAH